MEKILEGLNREQLEAVTHRQGPLLIIAGAGTGKTTVITRRIAWLISQGLAKTNEILALTFTDKAAVEMQERVDILVPYGYTDIWISTFHAFGDRVLRENAITAGLNQDFKVLTQPEAAVFFREHLFEFELSYYRPLAEPTRFIEAMISLFSRAKDEDISPKEYLDFAQDLTIKAKENPRDLSLNESARQQMEIALAYEKYQQLLGRFSLIDFGNQFYLALQLLREHPLVLKNYQQQFKFILVDEFQDTNFAQYQLVKLLAGASGNITVTGDDDQCIYRFRGAAYSNLLSFIRDFPQAAKVSIIQNYRSSQVILDSAYRLIQNNNPERFEVKAGIDKHLVSLKKGGLPVCNLSFDASSTESDRVAKMIKEKVDKRGFKFSDFAILVRSNSDAQAFLQSLNMQNIPWQFSGNVGLYAREEVKLCINFLRVTANPLDSMSLYYLASSEIYAVDPVELSILSHHSRRRNKPLYLVFKELEAGAEFSGISDGTREKVSAVLADLEKFTNASRAESSGRLLYAFLSDTGYLKRLTHQQSLENEDKIQNLARFFNIVRDFGLVAREDYVINFVKHLDLLIESGDDPATAEADLDSDAVNVLTIHKAKGLEFRVVFMVGLIHGRFPWPHRRQQIELPDELIKEVLPSGDFHLQEERRLFYVGMTRAKDELYFTSAADYGGSRLRRPSRFISEALSEDSGKQRGEKASAVEAIERFAPSAKKPKVVPERNGTLRPVHLTAYQIDDYLTCPLKYKYVHILHVPIMEHHTVIYGRAMHEAVSKYFQAKAKGGRFFCADLLESFRTAFDPQGFLDRKHQEERLKVGEEALARFFCEEEKSSFKPHLIEKDFSFIFENNKITGRFDRVDKRPEGAVIVDFKTSQIDNLKDAHKRVKESKQLKIYALAYQHIFKELPARIELYFLESGVLAGIEVGDDELAEAAEDIREVSCGIRGNNFEAKPAYMACKYCAYSQICPRAQVR